MDHMRRTNPEQFIHLGDAGVKRKNLDLDENSDSDDNFFFEKFTTETVT